MLPNVLNRFAKVASIAAFTFGVALAAQPAQKVSAQVITGAGASSVADLADILRQNNSRYVISGSGAGRNAFQNGGDFVATDGTLPSVDGQVVANEAVLNVAFPLNVPGFSGQISGADACSIINGADVNGNTINNWNQITDQATGQPGPDLTIVRVVRGDNSGTSAVLQSQFINGGCNQGGFNIQAFDPGNGALIGIPNQRDTDIIVPGAGDPFNSGDDNNSGNYSLGVLSAIQNTPGAIGYAEDALANNRGIPIATNVDTGETTAAAGPTFVVFRGSYGTQEQADAAVNTCLAITNSDTIQSRGYQPGGDAVSGGNGALCSAIQGPQ